MRTVTLPSFLLFLKCPKNTCKCWSFSFIFAGSFQSKDFSFSYGKFFSIISLIISSSWLLWNPYLSDARTPRRSLCVIPISLVFHVIPLALYFAKFLKTFSSTLSNKFILAIIFNLQGFFSILTFLSALHLVLA